nr:hypothetical protein [Corallincola sp.]
VLLPLLPPPGSAEVVLNITGGTKAFLAGLLLVYPWTTLDYRAKNKRHLHSVRFDGGHNRAPTLGDERWLPIPDLPPMALAKLQAETATQLPLNALISRQPLATLALAEQLWQGELTQDTALDYLLSQLELLWVKQAEEKETKVAHRWLPWPPEPAARTDLIDGWLTPLASIAARTSLLWDERGIRVVGNSAKGKKDPLRRWLSGAWLEQLAEHWLLCAGVPASAIARNVVRSSEKGESSSAREADLLVLFNCQATVVEAKADLPRGTAAKSMEEQLSSLGDLFGSTRKVLLIGPRLLAGLNDKGRKNLETRLRSNNGAQLCIDRESLLKAIDPTLIQALTPSAGGDSGR